MLRYARAEGGHVVLRSVAKQGHVMLCFTRWRRARVTWYAVSQAKRVHVVLRFTGKTGSRGVRHPGMQGGGEWSQINSQSEDDSTSVIACHFLLYKRLGQGQKGVVFF
ncbi:hypothetical protein chiPu_0012874 [Chiloscyllium punctatum]|uniref:Uncharacterized protein n=1 Tax=Chiloscyllium punctatum TaxID=137246 RepID=A0A401SVI6_CHIPU|nr:hypothetical protein [Chiloscyllium punctatum]